MANYVHPMQPIYNHKITKILQNTFQFRNRGIEFEQFVTILRQNKIKFYSHDDLSKLAKLSELDGKINLKQAFEHLELISTQNKLEAQYFLVKFRGKTINEENSSKLIESHKNSKISQHGIKGCILYFHHRMEKLYGKQTFWYRALGGVTGANTINKDIFNKKITKLFINSCHCTCINRFIQYVVSGCLLTHVSWESVRNRLGLQLRRQIYKIKTEEVEKLQDDFNANMGESGKKKHLICMRMKTFCKQQLKQRYSKNEMDDEKKTPKIAKFSKFNQTIHYKFFNQKQESSIYKLKRRNILRESLKLSLDYFQVQKLLSNKHHRPSLQYMEVARSKSTLKG